MKMFKVLHIPSGTYVKIHFLSRMLGESSDGTLIRNTRAEVLLDIERWLRDGLFIKPGETVELIENLSGNEFEIVEFEEEENKQ